MESHAVPQHIQSYQFRLVGDMTLKQFSELAGGIVIGFMVYNLPLYFFIKWPIIIFSVLLGTGMAFVPIEERPLETWIVAFFKAVYAPTQYLWRKVGFIPEILTAPLSSQPIPAVEIIAPQGKEKLQEYLNSLPQEQVTSVDQDQKEYFRKIDQLFATTTLPQESSPTIRPVPESPPGPSTAPHPLHPQADTADYTPRGKPQKIVIEPVTPPTTLPYIPPTPKYQESTRSATFSLDIPFPVTPTMPNLVVGMVLSPEGKIVENAILEIRESATGHPVRAMKTNKIGQFSIITALKNGTYDIITEKDEFAFDSVNFEAKGEIIPPIEIRAKSIN
jgi:hypothetical protein